MPLRPLCLAALLAVAAAGPAAGEEAPARTEDEGSLPPLLVRWPLAPKARAEPLPPEPPVTPVRPPEAAPAPQSRLEPSLEPDLEPSRPEATTAVRPEDVERPLRPVLEPPPSGPLERPGPRLEAPEPIERGRPSPGARVAATDDDKGGGRGGTRTDVQVDLPSVLLPPPRLALALGNFEVEPPNRELRRWRFPEQEGMRWSSTEDSSREGDWVILRGAVDVHVGEDRIQADEVRLNEKTKQLLAEGNVVLDHLDSRLAGERMDFDLETNTGTVWNAVGYARGDITFTGERVEKVGPNKYVVYDGSFTSCTQPNPIWHVKVSKAIVDVDNFVYLFNPRVLFKSVPAAWFPWGAIPIKQERSTGFMIPKISSSSVRGLSISEDFFWAINRSTDLTIGGQWWDEFGWSTDATARWHLNGMSSPGRFEAIYVASNEPEEVNGRLLDEARWYASFEHAQDVWEDWKLTVRGELGSDRLTQQQPFFDLEGNLGAPTPVFNQRVTLQRRWGKHSLSINLENDDREAEQAYGTIYDTGAIRSGTTSFRRLPEAEYRLSSTQLGGKTWLAFQGEAALGHYQASRPITYDGSIGGVPTKLEGDEYDHDWYTLDLYPQLRFPISNAFLEIIPSIGLRGTYWSRQQAPATERVVLFDPMPPADDLGPEVDVTNRGTVDESLFLWAWETGLRLGGPDFQRIYRRAALPGQRKWQHLIEPGIDFRYTPSVGTESPISQDRRNGHYMGRFGKTGAVATASLVNTLRSKVVVPVGEKTKPARDWLIWRLSADYNFRDRARTATFILLDLPGTADDVTRTEVSYWSDISSDVNFRPTEKLRFSLRNTYDILQDDIVSSSLTGGVEGDWGYVDLAFTSRRNPLTLEDQNTELTVTGEHWFYKNDRVRIGYDLTKSFNGPVPASTTQRARTSWPYKRLALSYFNQCCGVSLSWEDIDDRTVERERELTFIITLKDVGNFLRLRRSNSSN